MLVLSRKRNEDVLIGEGDAQVLVRVVEIIGDRVKLGFIAPDGITIMRTEITDKQKEQPKNGLERSPSRRPFYPF